jgi:uncharacterized protein
MESVWRRRSWHPYAVGAALGVLSWIAFATADRALGITTPFEHAASLALGESAGTGQQGSRPRVDWEWALVAGVLVGSWISARASGDGPGPVVPPVWARRFGGGVWLRMAGAFAGGAVMMFGARMAQGCTSGHGISGALQLAGSSWLFAAVFFPVAMLTALCMFPREANHV